MVWLTFSSSCFSPSAPCPSDQELIVRFTNHEAMFTKLAADPENKELLITLGIERVIKRPGASKRIWFEVWFKDLPGPGGYLKGYAYCEEPHEPPLSLVNTIDGNSNPGSAEIKEIYRKISGNWYLFYQSAN
jgi:hypothetical protein